MGLKGMEVEIDIKKMIFGGKAVGQYEGQRVVTSYGIVGQRVRAKIKRVRQTHLEANTLQVIDKSPVEKEEACPHTGTCGGCSLQGVPYQWQVETKNEQVKALFSERKLMPSVWHKPVSSPRIEGYRNKMEFSFGNQERGGQLTLGMHQRGRRYDVVDTAHCNLVDEDFRRIRTATATFFRERQVQPYHKISHDGILRHLVVRKAAFTGEIMVNLVTANAPELSVNEWKESLLSLELAGNLASILWTVNNQVADTVQNDYIQCLHGKESIRESLLGLNFTITPFSFFQTNSYAAECLYEIATSFLSETDQNVYDLYCGLGTITQLMARRASKVTGIELVTEAVEQARKDAQLNGFENCTFIAGDVKETLNQLPGRPDTLILDPPRAGVHPKAMTDLLAMKPEKMIYISCNPRSLVDNLEQATATGWHIESAQCVDLFPNTPHVECVVLMSKKEAN
ncbi:23S rRNA (uracil(1939)-C(5))-methyltransferase RlmD [Anoxynatronum buryatiense]|uniref:23S rRNA m(5)U-1939 methyltransferase n=1 Tax=Anoxynatronum buryatiense TaxID=489973 RepID=A0AA45WU99_9CLOT|nr:23S rRNA (uracil(1939)-C(5))-methyltransferase RlmD [Anoxynatronum buryatiense]SMP46444.1 23S rRNA m(5)U-1939 methyltransferase [Anoxynatronum buryatiense]